MRIEVNSEGGLLAKEVFNGLVLETQEGNMLTVCMDRELCEARLRVVAVHPGRLRTDVGAMDADTSPNEAAVALADWIERVGPETPCVLHDLMGGGHLDW